jgi:hypothetical protein
MRRRQHRHPALETAVFAAALLLSAFIARELWRRRATPAPAAETGRQGAIELNPTRPPLPSTTPGGRTEQAVTGVPPLKLSRLQPHKPKPEAVPAPK